MTEPSQERLLKDVQRVLNNPLGIPDLKVREVYSRIHDDHDGTYEGNIRVMFGPDGDGWVETYHPHNGSLRFRNFFGGGQSLRVLNALLILAYAIKLDNEDRPQYRPENKEE